MLIYHLFPKTSNGLLIGRSVECDEECLKASILDGWRPILSGSLRGSGILSLWCFLGGWVFSLFSGGEASALLPNNLVLLAPIRLVLAGFTKSLSPSRAAAKRNQQM